MDFDFLAIIVGGVGPYVWDKEVPISAADFMDAAQQAQAKAEEWGGQVVSLEQNDKPPLANLSSLFVLGGIAMSMEYIRKTYGVPAKRGGRLIYTDSDGAKFYCTIKSATHSGRLNVLVDDRVPGYLGRMKLHPTWNVEYLPPNAELNGTGGTSA